MRQNNSQFAADGEAFKDINHYCTAYKPPPSLPL